MKRIKILCLIAVFGTMIIVPSCKDVFVEEEEFITRNPSEGGESEANPYWDWADKYPGVVSSRIERARDVEVVVEGGYTPIAIAPETPSLQSTGLFVASGEYVTIDVPAGVDKLHWQVGLGYKLLEGQFRKRYTDVTTKGLLEPGENRISSYFGGYLYFYYEPGDVPSNDVTVTVSGAVQSDDFHLGETVQSTWLPRMQERAELLKNPSDSPDSMAFLNWTELHSRHLILTAGVSELTYLKNANKLMESYDLLIETAYKWAGLDIEKQPKLRLYTDIQLPDAGQTTLSSGAKLDYYGKYPIGFLRGETPTTFVSEKKVLDILYAQGQPDPDEGGPFIKLCSSFADAFSGNWMTNSLFTPSVDRMFLMNYTYTTQGVAPGSVIADFKKVVTNLNTDFEMWRANSIVGVAFYKNDDILTFFMQLAKQYGWPLFYYLNERSREENVEIIESELKQIEYIDFLAMTVSEYAGRNLVPYFEKWKCYPSTPAREYCALFPSLGKDELFYTDFDPTAEVSTVPRTPDRSHIDVRPPFGLQKTLSSSDDKEFWCISGELLDYDTEEVRVSNNSDSNTNWKKIFDNDPTTNCTPLGDIQTSDASVTHHQHRPIFTMDFMRPKMIITDREVEGEEEDEYGEMVPVVIIEHDTTYVPTDKPHTFNALVISNIKADYAPTYIYNMEYEDVNGTWRQTTPSQFWLYASEDWYYYPFAHTYKAKKFRYELHSICPSTGNVARVIMNDIDWMMLESRKQELPGDEE